MYEVEFPLDYALNNYLLGTSNIDDDLAPNNIQTIIVDNWNGIDGLQVDFDNKFPTKK